MTVPSRDTLGGSAERRAPFNLRGPVGLSPARLLVCDEHAVFPQGLRAILEAPELELLEASSVEAALQALSCDPEIDVVLLATAHPGADRWAGLRRIRGAHPEVAVVIASAAHSDEAVQVRAALASGAAGFIPKSSSPEVFRGALRLVLAGGSYLPPCLLDEPGGTRRRSPSASPAAEPTRRGSPGARLTGRQRDILFAASRGLTNAEIAVALGIAPGTVKTHLSAIYHTLDVANRTEAALLTQGMDLER